MHTTSTVIALAGFVHVVVPGVVKFWTFGAMAALAICQFDPSDMTISRSFWL
jgi:hypothetical protein